MGGQEWRSGGGEAVIVIDDSEDEAPAQAMPRRKGPQPPPGASVAAAAPSLPQDVWSGAIAPLLGFKHVLLLASSSTALQQMLACLFCACCVNTDSSNVRRMLVVAAKHGKTEHLRCLLRCTSTGEAASAQHPHSPDAEELQRLWKRALSRAVWAATLGRHSSVVGLLLENGASANDKNKPGITLVMQAICHHDNASLDVLIRAKANITQMEKGWLPLHVAAQQDNASAVVMLLEAGANVNAVDYDAVTPLLQAIKKRSSRTSSALTGVRSLHDAAEQNLDTVEALIQGGANVNDCRKVSGSWTSPVIKAIEMQVPLHSHHLCVDSACSCTKSMSHNMVHT